MNTPVPETQQPSTSTSTATQSTPSDLLVVGAGPTGLACAIEAQKSGFSVILVDKGCLCNSLFHYPAHMTFFTTSERLEIGGIPFPSPNAKPSRDEALQYYRLVAAYYKLEVRQYHRVDRISGADGAFTVHTTDRFGRPGELQARKLVISSGYYDLPNWMGIPGETLSKVHHYYNDPHPYFEMDVAVIGGKNSAAIAALELWRQWRARHADLPRAWDHAERKVLDQAGYRKPHQRRRSQGLLRYKRRRNHPRRPHP